jgi:hypothetical protein
VACCADLLPLALLMLLASPLAAQPARNVVGWGEIGSFLVPADATNVVAASVCEASAVAVRADGTLLLWGGPFATTNLPPGFTNILDVSAGPGYGLVLGSDGTVVQLGVDQGNITGQIPPNLSNVVAVATGAYGAQALRSDHTVVWWSQYKLFLVAGLTNVVAVAPGGPFMLALQPDGAVATTGSDPYGCGMLNVPPGLTNVVAVAAGDYFSMALRADGTVAVWGDNTFGQTNVPPNLSNVVAIAAGSVHCLALRADGTVVAWGAASVEVNEGQTDVPPGLTNVVSIAAGGYSSLAVTGAALPPAQVALTNMAFGPGGFSVQVPTDRQRVYGLEYKNSLADAQWTLLPLVAGTGGTVQLADPAPGAAQRFYRVRRW